MSNLIEPLELAAILSHADTVVLDGSWYLPGAGRDAKDEFATQHIPGARFFDIDAISDQDTALPHMAPPPVWFERKVRELGVSDTSRVVVYDTAGIFSAPRVWWLFRLFGHERVQVLNGGLPAWVEHGLATDDIESRPQPGNFCARPNPGLVADMQDMQQNATTGQSVVLDARPRPRFLGQAAEPRPELMSGHMPNATSLAFSELLEQGRYRADDSLRRILVDHGVTAVTPIITSCGSGVTAAVITLALDQCGFGPGRLYDGSWAEWAADPENPILRLDG